MIALAEEISRQLSIDSRVVISITLRQIYNEKEQAGQKETQNVQFEEKKSSRKCFKCK